ncbi:regucalcin [Ectocarpus siliculosus]|uniref:Regucalcin n=1 Tax=Ectocarpus siliculosus TaxID=2880 RepID=D7G1H5_ECTSI|nr:regucalcin [Ectocarpus siliculosus]|eukprot:CBJ26783.1 regucalcin [Ectocarpus siliculosus]
MLAEGVSWNHLEQELWWVDINGKMIMRLFCKSDEDGEDGLGASLAAEGWDVQTRPGSLALREGGARGRKPGYPLVVAFEDGFFLCDPSTGGRVAAAAAAGGEDEYEQLPNTRLNDGRCDRQGRFLCGGINLENIDQPPDLWKPRAGVFRLEEGKGVRRILPDEEFRCYNGTCFSPDGRTMYAAETPLQKIARYDYNPDTGDITNKRVFVELEEGYPDGATVDTEGCVWVAMFSCGEVRRFSPEGELLRTIPVPGAKNTTCVAIGGPDLDILFITSASVGLNDQQRMEQPNAGAVFAIRLEGVKGIPEPRFRG